MFQTRARALGRAARAAMVTDDEEEDDEGDLLCRLPRVSIEYCSRCKWMLRSAWLAQELLTTFNGTLKEVALQPNGQCGGVWVACLADKEGEITLWDRKERGGFPEPKELKQLICDAIDPSRDLGHSGGGGSGAAASSAKSALQRLKDLLGVGRPNRRRGG